MPQPFSPAPFAEVIGDPIAHSKSPLIHRFWLEELGLPGDYRATRVAAEDLAAFLAERRDDQNWRGCNVTVPHKQAVMPYLDDLDPTAQGVGAVNTVVREQGSLVGRNSDVAGIVAALAPFDSSRFDTVCLIGSGGAALAALAAFRQLGISSVLLNVRDQAKGCSLLATSGFEGRVGGIDDRANIRDADLIVNATTLGMEGQDAMPETLLGHIQGMDNDRAVLFDMVYKPLETAFLQAGAHRGLRVADGLAMLVGQAASAFEAFFGAPAPRQHDAQLRTVLTS